MTCKHCGTTFDETKVIRLQDELICCPNCTALQNAVDEEVDEEATEYTNPVARILHIAADEEDDEEDEEEVTKYTNSVARILHIIALITWTAGVLFIMSSLFINRDAITFFTCCCYLYAVFVSGMFTYAFAEVIQLLTDIRDS